MELTKPSQPNSSELLSPSVLELLTPSDSNFEHPLNTFVPQDYIFTPHSNESLAVSQAFTRLYAAQHSPQNIIQKINDEVHGFKPRAQHILDLYATHPHYFLGLDETTTRLFLFLGFQNMRQELEMAYEMAVHYDHLNVHSFIELRDRLDFVTDESRRVMRLKDLHMNGVKTPKTSQK